MGLSGTLGCGSTAGVIKDRRHVVEDVNMPLSCFVMAEWLQDEPSILRTPNVMSNERASYEM